MREIQGHLALQIFEQELSLLSFAQHAEQPLLPTRPAQKRVHRRELDDDIGSVATHTASTRAAKALRSRNHRQKK